jgi:MFS family permease
MVPTTFFAGLLIYCWAAVNTLNGQLAFVIVYGYFAAGVQSLFPATLSSLTTDLKKMGVRVGMVFSIISIACLTGPPLAGALIHRKGGDYLYAQIFGGTVVMCGSLFLIAARVAKTGFQFKQRM